MVHGALAAGYWMEFPKDDKRCPTMRAISPSQPGRLSQGKTYSPPAVRALNPVHGVAHQHRLLLRRSQIRECLAQALAVPVVGDDEALPDS